MHTKIYFLHFPKETGDKPIICELVKKYDIEFNILKATILPGNDGIMVLELTGHKKNVKSSIDFLEKYGVKVESISTIIRRDDSLCIQCGACTGICPTNALFVQRPDMGVLFAPEKCNGCGLCVPVCPVRAMEVTMDQDIISGP